MEKLTIVWEKPFKFSGAIPNNLKAAIGLYILEKDTRIFYVGKSEEQGGFKRAKDHLRGQMDIVGKCVLEKAKAKDKDEINIWVAWIEKGEDRLLIDSAEKLLTWYCGSECNKTDRGKYTGPQLVLVNDGDRSDRLPPTIASPT